MSRLNRQTGELIIDHRASPGLTTEQAIACGYDPKQCGEGKLFEVATLSCSHCRGVQIKNPLRTRDRSYCRKCNAYICDGCYFAAAMPDYIHAPFDKVVDVWLDLAAKKPFHY